jgi:hypothetical protein
MGDVINLRRARKARDREAAERAATESRARHGRTKSERALEEAQVARFDRHLDQSRRETRLVASENDSSHSASETESI